MVLMQWCMGHFFPNANQSEDNSQLDYIVTYVSFVSVSFLAAIYFLFVHSECWIKFLQVIRWATN